jgi:protein-S-isoprenylcysteine O-methyltransferase Ste14
MTSAINPVQRSQGINRHRVALGLVALPMFFVLFMFMPAGTWVWTKGWLFILVFLVIFSIGASYLWRVNPEVMIARSRIHEGMKRWDIILLCFFFPAMLGIIPVAALDDGQFHWFPLAWWVSGIGYVLFLAGMGIILWAEAVNKFCEQTVRIQTERGHKVIDTGLYAIVRHPGYVGGLLLAMGMPLSLGSLWAMIPASLAFVLLILRTLLEDQTLQAELTGYKDYTKRVHYRLIPWVW